jgi:hypothetical protein
MKKITSKPDSGVRKTGKNESWESRPESGARETHKNPRQNGSK